VGYQYPSLVRALTELAPSLKKNEKELNSVVLPRLTLYGSTPGLDLLPVFLRVLEQTDTPTQVTRCVQRREKKHTAGGQARSQASKQTSCKRWPETLRTQPLPFHRGRYAYFFVGRILSELDADSSTKLDGMIQLLRHDVAGSSLMRQSLALSCLTQAAATGVTSPAEDTVGETVGETQWERRWGRHSGRDGGGDTVGETVGETQWRDGGGDTVGETVGETQ
jgi:hypothetical protein